MSGRDRASRIEKEALRESILGQAAPPRRRRLWAGPALALAGAAAALLLLPWALDGEARERSGASGEFTPRGEGEPAAALELVCASSQGATCRQGEKLFFDVSARAGYRHLAAFARREDGTVIWYFPESEGAGGASLERDSNHGILDRGVVLGERHPRGRYRVFAVFSERALSRGAIEERFDPEGLSAGPGTAVVSRELTIR